MPPFFTAAQCEGMLTKLYEASMALSEGKIVSISGATGGRSITRMSAFEIESSIKLWEGRLSAAQRKSSGPRIRLVNPI